MNEHQKTQLKLASWTIREPRTVIYKSLSSRRNNYYGRASRLGVPNCLTFDQLLALFNASLWKCVYCGRQLTLIRSSESEATLDHIIPMARGGQNALCNVVPCCRACNNSKENREMLSWLDEQGLSLDRFAMRYGSMWNILKSRPVRM